LVCSPTPAYDSFLVTKRRIPNLQHHHPFGVVASAGYKSHPSQHGPKNGLVLLLQAESSPWSSKEEEEIPVLSNQDEILRKNFSPHRRIIKSQILSIRSQNLAGIVGADHDNNGNELGGGGAIGVDFPILGSRNGSGSDKDKEQARTQQSLIACTGETGSGKTLLMVRVAELLAGGKAPVTLLASSSSSSSSRKNDGNTRYSMTAQESTTNGNNSAVVEMTLLLAEPHFSAVQEALMENGIRPRLASQPPSETSRADARISFLHLKRTISLQSSSSSGGNNSRRIKSTCHVNGQLVPLKFLAALTGSLLTIVDASSAAAALARPETRMSILDTAVSSSRLAYATQSRARYRKCRLERERLQDELASRVLPMFFSRPTTNTANNGEEDVELLNHWINELDAFQTRVETFVRVLGTNQDDTAAVSDSSSSRLVALRKKLMSADWMDKSSAKTGQSFSSTLYDCLQELKNVLLTLENQLIAAQNAANAIASLSTMESAATAVQRAREFLFAATSSSRLDASTTDDRLSEAAEQSHDHLNQVEEKIKQCARYLEDDDRGLICTLENLRSAWPVSVEQCDEILSYWSFLARKHGIPPKTLPSCHKALMSERDGNVEALTLLPLAMAAEQEALKEFEAACADLTHERKAIAQRLSASVNERLPSLGMETSTFRVEVSSDRRKCTDASVFSSGPVLGVDVVDFMIMQGAKDDRNDVDRGGPVHETASLGEKSRILLAIECVVSGAVGAACGNQKIGAETIECLQKLPPIAVLYDEIDAHVGGRAAVSVAKILAEQSQRSQVLAITHSPSVAAMASLHVVVQKVPVDNNNSHRTGSSSPIRMMVVNGADKRKELARMASGDMIPDAAEAFAEALIQDARKKQM
jgi:DNA repair ATPase RecN